MKRFPRSEDFNPKRNRILDTQGTTEVTLLAFPAKEYSEKTQFLGMIQEMSRTFTGKGQYRDFETLQGEFAAKNVFGTEQLPLLLSFGLHAYAAFIPNMMEAEELANFKEGVAREGLKLRTIIARKNERDWSYELLD